MDLQEVTSDLESPAMAMDSRGGALLAWSKAKTIFVSERAPEGRFGAPVAIGSGTGVPMVAAADSGERVIASFGPSDRSTLNIHTRLASGQLTRLQTFGATGQSKAIYAVGLALDGRGNAFASWYDDGVVKLSVRSSDGVFRAPVDVAGPSASPAPVAVGASGEAVLVWLRLSGPCCSPQERGAIESRTVSTDGQLGPVVTLAQGAAKFSVPSVGVDAAGNAVVAWLDRGIVMVATRSAGQPFAPAQPLFTGRGDQAPRVLINQAGDVAVRQGTQLRFRPAGGDWGPVEQVPLVYPFESQTTTAMNATGTIAVAGTPFDAQFVLVALRPRAGRFAPAQGVGVSPLGDAQVQPSVGVDPSGNPVAVFVRQTAFGMPGSGAFMSSSFFDPRYRTGPLIWADVFGGDDDIFVVRDRGGLAVQVAVSVPATLQMLLRVDGKRARDLGLGRRPITIGRATLRRAPLREREVLVRLTRRARRALVRKRRVRTTLTISATDRRGVRRSVRQALVIG